MFLNALPVNPAVAGEKDKQRAPNALVPSTLAYAGGLMDFDIDMGSEVGSSCDFASSH